MPEFIFKVTADISIPARDESEARAKARMVTDSLEWSLTDVKLELTAPLNDLPKDANEH